jgi:hypothetical protein
LAAWHPRPSRRYRRTHPSCPRRLPSPRAAPRPGQRSRLARLDYLNPGIQPANPSYLHLPPPRFARIADVRKHKRQAWAEKR